MNQSLIDNNEAGRGTLGSYMAGFILSAVLTAIPFALVMPGALPRQATLAAITGAAIGQVLVHLYFFLHMDASPGARRYVLAMLFTLLIMFLIVGGTLWLMYHLNYRLM